MPYLEATREREGEILPVRFLFLFVYNDYIGLLITTFSLLVLLNRPIGRLDGEYFLFFPLLALSPWREKENIIIIVPSTNETLPITSNVYFSLSLCAPTIKSFARTSSMPGFTIASILNTSSTQLNPLKRKISDDQEHPLVKRSTTSEGKKRTDDEEA